MFLFIFFRTKNYKINFINSQEIMVKDLLSKIKNLDINLEAEEYLLLIDGKQFFKDDIITLRNFKNMKFELIKLLQPLNTVIKEVNYFSGDKLAEIIQKVTNAKERLKPKVNKNFKIIRNQVEIKRDIRQI